MDPILIIILGIFLFSTAFDLALSYVNQQHQKDSPPERLKAHIDAEQYAKSREYHKTRQRFGWLRTGISTTVLLFVLISGALGWLDGQIQEMSTHFIVRPLLFFGILYVVNLIFSLPFSWYSTFVIEEKFGFNRSTAKTFWLDQVKSLVLTVLFGGSVMSFLLWLVDLLGPDFWIWFWIFISGISLIISVFYTSILLPLFNKLSPLDAGELRSKIEAYAQTVSFPLTHILVMDGSRRSAKGNAFFSGIGKRKKVVLYDTLIEKQSEEELVSVLAHEVGHYKKKHVVQGLVISILQTGMTLFILSRFVQSEALTTALGGEDIAIHLNLIAFGLLYSPISTLLGIGMNVLSRKNEYEADAYAAETYSPEPLQSALIKLHTDSLSNLTPHPWYVGVYYSHPPLLARLEALDQYT